ncbi:cell wall-binding repeat-containing protein [Eggerthella guodeyinii]|uniref:Cell wall-binding repeat-containing protein n=1 Tax=Eggerthella guodeyinii TaxID=2690837 RepID=A0A7M1ZSA7_9ACTN|nr:cell wall-binding repeat-containing protein [Eggerthella guodeyinii]QOS67180.1 cell wall-binding repeat-containing protein [Eggerthella guodeyinii]
MALFRKVSARRLAALFALATLASLASASSAWATADDQKSMATEEEVAAALVSGEIKTELPADGASEGGQDGLSARSVTNKRIKSIYGTTQYDTAAKEALHAYSKASTVIVASGESYVDALSATSLAGALGCPILLTSRTSLPDSTAAAIRSLSPSEIIVVGGPGVVSEGVCADLGDLAPQVSPLYGTTGCDTQIEIYEYGLSRSLWDPEGRVIVASGSVAPGCFADALSASPVAFKLKIPVFITAESGKLPEKSLETLLDGRAKQAIIAGGTGVVSAETEGELEAITVDAGGSANVVRRWGETLYDTSADLATWAVENGILKWDDAAFATGKLPYDALAGSVVQGKEGSVLLIADPGRTATADVLARQSISTYKYFGGSALFDNAFKVQVAYKTNMPLYEIDGLVVYVDAGHGWDSSNNNVFDWGASGNGLVEFNLTKELAGKVATTLRSVYGVTAYVNDDGGYYAYRQAEAHAMNAGVLVSIHFNASGGRGTESYIHSYNAAPGASTLQRKTHSALVSGLGIPDRGMKQEEFAVCGGGVPGVLLEVAFIDNKADMDAYGAKKDVVARSIAKGIAA